MAIVHVVDDDRVIRELIAETLGARGHVVHAHATAAAFFAITGSPSSHPLCRMSRSPNVTMRSTRSLVAVATTSASSTGAVSAHQRTARSAPSEPSTPTTMTGRDSIVSPPRGLRFGGFQDHRPEPTVA